MKIYIILVSGLLITGSVTAYPNEVTIKNDSDSVKTFFVAPSHAPETVVFNAVDPWGSIEFKNKEGITYSKAETHLESEQNKIQTFNFEKDFTGAITLIYTNDGFKKVTEAEFEASLQRRKKHFKKMPTLVMIKNDTGSWQTFETDRMDVVHGDKYKERDNVAPHSIRTIAEDRNSDDTQSIKKLNGEGFKFTHIYTITNANDPNGPKIVHSFKIENANSGKLFLIYSKNGFKSVTEKAWNTATKK